MSILLVVALVLLSMPWPVAAQRVDSRSRRGVVAGQAYGVDNRPLAHATVRLRNFRSGGLLRTLIANDNGGFSFIDVPAGEYVAELVDPKANKVVGTSSVVTLAPPAAMVAGAVVVKATAAMATAGVATAGGFFGTTALGVVLAAAGAGVTAGVSSTSPVCSLSK